MSSKNKESKVCLRCCKTLSHEVLECPVCKNQVFNTAWLVHDWRVVQMIKYFLPTVEELVKQLPDINFKQVWLDFLMDKPEAMKHHCCEIENHDPMQELFDITMDFSLSLPPHENIRLLIGVLFAQLLESGVTCDTELLSNRIQCIGLDAEQIEILKQGLANHFYPVLEPLVTASEEDIARTINCIVRDDKSNVLTDAERAYLCDRYEKKFEIWTSLFAEPEVDVLPFKSWRDLVDTFKLSPAGMPENPLPVIQWASLYCLVLKKEEEAKLCLNYCIELADEWQSSSDCSDDAIIFLFNFVQGLEELDSHLKNVSFSSVSTSLDKLMISIQSKFSRIFSMEDDALNQELIEILDEQQALVTIDRVLRLINLEKFSEAEAKLSKVLLLAQNWSIEEQTEFEDEAEYTRYIYRCQAKLLAYCLAAYIKADQKSFHQAIQYANQANELAELIPMEEIVVYPQAALGYIYFRWGRTARAERSFSQVFRLLNKNTEVSSRLKIAVLPMKLIVEAYTTVLNKMGRRREARNLTDVWNKAS